MMERDIRSNELPWSRRLRFRKGARHSTSLDQLQQIAFDDKVAQFHLQFLLFASISIEHKALPQWRIVYALGPFSGMREPRRIIPFITVASFTKPYRHISLLSKLLAEPFSEFGIMPDIYMLPTKSHAYLSAMDLPAWDKTLMTAVPIYGSAVHA